MSIQTTKHTLPDLPHPEFLRKQAKARLAVLRSHAPSAKLAHVQFVMAQEFGFSSWGALLAEVARRQESPHGQWRRIRRNPLALSRDLSKSEDTSSEAHFLHAGAATHIGFVLSALIGVALVFAVGGDYPAITQQISLLTHR